MKDLFYKIGIILFLTLLSSCEKIDGDDLTDFEIKRTTSSGWTELEYAVTIDNDKILNVYYSNQLLDSSRVVDYYLDDEDLTTLKDKLLLVLNTKIYSEYGTGYKPEDYPNELLFLNTNVINYDIYLNANIDREVPEELIRLIDFIDDLVLKYDK